MTIKLALCVLVQGPPRALHLRSQETISFWYSVQVKLEFSISAALFDLRVLEEALISTSIIQSEVIQNFWRCGTLQRLQYICSDYGDNTLNVHTVNHSSAKSGQYSLYRTATYWSAFFVLTTCICVLKQLEEACNFFKINQAFSFKHIGRKQIRATHPLRCDALDLIFCLN